MRLTGSCTSATSRPPAAVLSNEIDAGRFEDGAVLRKLAHHVGGALLAFRARGY